MPQPNNIYNLVSQSLAVDQRQQIVLGQYVDEDGGKISWLDPVTQSSDGNFYPAQDGLAATCTAGDWLLILRVQRFNYVVVCKLVV